MVIDNELFTINISGLSMNMTKHFYFGLFSAEYANLSLPATQYTALVPGIVCIVFRLHNQNKQ
jgi:hypothetical protein